MKKDPNAPADTRTMAIVHSALRRDLERARVVLAAPERPTEERRRALADHLVWMMTFLERHHRGEDTGLYPMVLEHRPDARELLEAMDAEHQAIHGAMDRLVEVAGAYRPPSTATEADVLSAVEDLQTVLLPHLRHEEDELMPVVSAALTTREWDEWEHAHNQKGLPIRELARTGLWILDGLDPEGDALISGLVPPPVRLLVKKGFGPGYRRMAERLWGGTPAAGIPSLRADASEAGA